MRIWQSVCLALTLTTCAQHPGPGDVLTLLDTASGDDWPAYGRTYGEQHYSPLAQIDRQNVGQLGLAWSLDLPPGNTVTQPLEIAGVLYFTVGNSIIHAVEASSGKERWVFDPHANEAAGPRMRTSWGSRGIAYWNGKIYTGTVDGRLIAVDSRTGKEVWSQQTLQSGDLRYITGAPRAFDGKIIIGHGGADSADMRGYVTTYDAESGRQLWRFFLVPGNPQDGPDGAASDPVMPMAAATWSGEWWKFGGGGSAWNSFTYDAETDTILIGTGNGAPWNHRIRSNGKGDNLFLCSIVALDAKTGRYKWHYQINPGETWDYNASMDMHLAVLPIGGQPRKVLITAPKNGFLYVIDRLTGKLLSAEKVATRVTWASHIDLASGRPVESPDARFPAGKPFELWPNISGAHTNLPSAYSPKARLVYIPLGEAGVIMSDEGIDYSRWRRRPGGVYDYGINMAFNLSPSSPPPSSALLAWDPVAGKAAWKVPTPMFWNGGLMATGGDLVFQGQVDGRFSAYDAVNGRRLWTFDAGGAVLAPPISYSVGGRQYVTVLTGMGLSGGMVAGALPRQFDYRTQARRVLTFALGGKSTIPRSENYVPTPIEDADYVANPDAAVRGAMVFAHCSICHGRGADAGGGIAPDLRTSTVPQSAEAFNAVVREGVLVSQGMPVYPELTDQQMQDVRQFIRERAAALRSAPQKPPKSLPPLTP